MAHGDVSFADPNDPVIEYWHGGILSLIFGSITVKKYRKYDHVWRCVETLNKPDVFIQLELDEILKRDQIRRREDGR